MDHAAERSRRTVPLLILAAFAILAFVGLFFWWFVRDHDQTVENEISIERDEAKAELEARRARGLSASKVEGEPLQGLTPAATAQFLLLVLDPDGEPVADARLDLYPHDGAHFILRTDADGLAVTDQREDSASIFVLATGWWPQRFDEVPLSKTEHTLRLKPGESFEGHLIHDDGRPAVGLKPGLWIGGRTPGILSRGLKAAEATAIQTVWSKRLACLTDENGHFIYRGLPATGSWNAHLYPPQGYGFLNDVDATIQLIFSEAPIGLRVPLTRLPQLTMRFVAGEDRRPVPGASVQYAHDRGRSLDHTNSAFADSDEDGRIVIDIATRRFYDFLLAIPLSDRAPEIRHIEPFVGLKDLGDILLPARRDITIEITDASGKPLAGAFVGIEGTNRTGGPSDVQGYCLLKNVTNKELSIEATAAGFATSKVAISKDQQQAKLVLLRGDTLEVLAFDSEGNPRAMAPIAIAWPSDKMLFGTPRGFPTALSQRVLEGSIHGGQGGPKCQQPT
ncbi:MAG: hypothetical protein V3W41_20365 [Planctomycetota bacterium]